MVAYQSCASRCKEAYDKWKSQSCGLAQVVKEVDALRGAKKNIIDLIKNLNAREGNRHEMERLLEEKVPSNLTPSSDACLNNDSHIFKFEKWAKI